MQQLRPISFNISRLEIDVPPFEIHMVNNGTYSESIRADKSALAFVAAHMVGLLAGTDEKMICAVCRQLEQSALESARKFRTHGEWTGDLDTDFVGT